MTFPPNSQRGTEAYQQPLAYLEVDPESSGDCSPGWQLDSDFMSDSETESPSGLLLHSSSSEIIWENTWFFSSVQFSWVAQSCPTLCNTMDYNTPTSLSITNSRSLPKLMSIELVMPSNRLILCHPLLLSSSIFPSSGSFQISQLFASGGQSIRVSASTSVLPMKTQDWSPLGWTGWISLQSKELPRVFSNTTV